MNQVALSGGDTITLQNYLFTGLADGDAVDLTFPNEIMTVKIGKNGNAIYGYNAMGAMCDCVMRILRASADDKFLNNLLSTQQSNPSGFILMSGTFIKKLGDGLGNITSDTYVLGGGVFSKQIEGKMNVEGATDQSLSVYHLKFSSGVRAIT